jgi:hypothetical protein
MNWLAENVDGRIPLPEEIPGELHSLVELQGVLPRGAAESPAPDAAQ